MRPHTTASGICFMKHPLCLLACLAGAGVGSAAQAIDLSASATVVSDYRFRGISNSGKDPALQIDLSASHESGFYVGAWGTNIDLFNDGPDIELDVYAGWSGDIAPGVTLDANLTRYGYPGVAGTTDYVEGLASIAFTLGPVGAKLGGGYFPDQKATGDDGSYVFGEISREAPGSVTLTGHLGRQWFGAGYGMADYWEWSVSATRSFGPIEAGIAYVDTSLPKGNMAGATVVASIGISF